MMFRLILTDPNVLNIILTRDRSRTVRCCHIYAKSTSSGGCSQIAAADLANTADGLMDPNLTLSNVSSFTRATVTTDMDGGAVRVLSSAPATPQPVTTLTGAVVRFVDGSGEVTLTPDTVQAGTLNQFITVQYKALTDLMRATLVITPEGIVTTDDSATTTVIEKLGISSGSYGYVYESEPVTKGTMAVESTTITWTNVKLARNETLTTFISAVRVKDDAMKYDWGVTLDDMSLCSRKHSPHLIPKMPALYVTKADAAGIDFTIDETNFPAGSKQKITFSFTASSTPIRDGQVRVRLPSTWSVPPAIKEANATVTLEGPGKVSVSGGTLEETNPLIPGSLIVVNVDKLELGETIEIKYGHGETTDRAVVQKMAQEKVPIYGDFRVAANTLIVTDKEEVNVGYAEDGSGSATIMASPGDNTVQAGSSRSNINVIFTATGTITGHVALELPSGWGAFQRDPIEPNYIEVLGANVTWLEPAIGSSSTRAAVKLSNKLESGGIITFRYGGGTGGDKKWCGRPKPSRSCYLYHQI